MSEFTVRNPAGTLTGRVWKLEAPSVSEHRQHNPLYHGMIMTAIMLENGSELSSATSDQTPPKACASLDASNTVRTLLINKSETTDYTVSLNLSGRGTTTL